MSKATYVNLCPVLILKSKSVVTHYVYFKDFHWKNIFFEMKPFPMLQILVSSIRTGEV